MSRSSVSVVFDVIAPTQRNKNLAIANTSRVSCAHNTYVESIYKPKYYNVTLKSSLSVTKGHWKRNRWRDHTRLTIILVELFDFEYYCNLELWVRGHSRSLKVISV